MSIEGFVIPPESLAAATKALEPAFRHALRVYRERQAARLAVPPTADLLTPILDDTLRRILGGSIDDPWWQRLLNVIEQPLVSPDILRGATVQEWLAKPGVQEDLKSGARALLLGSDHLESDLERRLSQGYSEATGERQELAKGPINFLTGILVAGYIASIPDAQKGVAGMVQAAAIESRQNFEHLTESGRRTQEQVGRLLQRSDQSFDTTIHNREAKKRLDIILKCRAFNTDRAREAIAILAHDVAAGELRHVTPEVRREVLYWLARLYASSDKTADQARAALGKLRAEAPGLDLRLPDALLRDSAGDPDGALAVLSAIDTDDGRSTYLSILRKTRGAALAEEWYRSHPISADLGLFTELGWYNVAVCLSERGHWEEAASILEALEPRWERWPDLAFLDGVVNAALLLPDPLRRHVLQIDIFHPAIRPRRGRDVPGIRVRAHSSFSKAMLLLGKLGELAEPRADFAAHWELWLDLTDPDPTIVKAAEERVQGEMHNAKRALSLLPFANGFDIRIDSGPLHRYLALRAKIGPLQPMELAAEFMLAEMELPPLEFAAFLDREEHRFRDALSRSALLGKHVEALANSGQAIKARELLRLSPGILADKDSERLEALIDARAGGDPRARLEKIYEETGDLLDLKNLARYLTEKQDWIALTSIAERLFTLERTAENASRLLHCYRNLPLNGAQLIAEFFARQPDVEDWSLAFAADRAWALFALGQVKEARKILNTLLAVRRESNDTQLDINIAIQSGEWERLSAIVDREWEHRKSSDADVLMRLAVIAAETDAGPLRALELAKLAAEKSPDDPRNLAAAYHLAVQLGKEDANPEWISRAVALSTEGGPIQRIDMRTLIEEMIPAHRERTNEVNAMLMRGEVPLHFAAGVFGLPISRMLIALPQRNEQAMDGRDLAIVPTFWGAHRPATISQKSRVAVDITSLMLLEWLGILPIALAKLAQVVLPPSTMIVLLNERRNVRFHQPSRVRKAERVRQLIDQKRLVVLSAIPQPPEWLVKEVGLEFAQMLEAARQNHTVVVRGAIVYKLGAYMQEEADLCDYAPYVISCQTFLTAMREAGHVIESDFRRGLAALDTFDPGQHLPAQHLLQGAYLLDELALTHFQDAGLLDVITKGVPELQIHPATKRDQDDLLAAGTEGKSLSERLDHIRETLRDLLASGKATFLPTGFGNAARFVPSITELLQNAEEYDAICVDDRCLNKFGQVSDKQGRTRPILCTLDLLNCLAATGGLTNAQVVECEHRLKAGGFALCNIDEAEMNRLVRQARVDPDGVLIESAELRTLRQYLLRLRAVGILQDPAELPFLERLQGISATAIRRLWEDNTLPETHALAATRWIWTCVAPNPIDWIARLRTSAAREQAELDLAAHIRLVATPLMQGDIQRCRAFARWVEDEILQPLLPANERLVDLLTEMLKKQILEVHDRFSARPNAVN